MQILFRNANLVDICSGKVKTVNILVEDGKFKDISYYNNTYKSYQGNEIDLKGDFVISPFVNVFCHSYLAFVDNYQHVDENDSVLRKLISDLMIAKNLLAGAYCNDLSTAKNQILLQNIEEKSAEELENLSDYVAKNKLKLFIKAGKTLDELGTVDLEFKQDLPHLLEDFGFLDRKPIIVGGNCFEKDDLELLSQYDCDLCLTVADDGKNGIRPTNLISLYSKNICVGLGSGENFEIDFFAFMRQILMTQRSMFESKNCLTESQVLELATVNGAQILGMKNFGLAVGNSADFIVVSNNNSLYADTLKTLVWEKSKRDVVMSVFGGEILQERGKILMKNVEDYDKIIEKIQLRLKR